VSIDLCLPNNETAVNTDNKQQQYGGTENLWGGSQSSVTSCGILTSLGVNRSVKHDTMWTPRELVISRTRRSPVTVGGGGVQ
jgi:hypothetical protein